MTYRCTLFLLLFFLAKNSFGQTHKWPFREADKSVIKGIITGTVGDFRADGSKARFHGGVDFVSQKTGKQGRAVYSMHDGIAKIQNNGKNGDYIAIQDTADKNYYIYYKHIRPDNIDPITGESGMKVEDGDTVNEGDFLGLMIVSSDIPPRHDQHLHVNDNRITSETLQGNTNWINGFLYPFTDLKAPEFIYPFELGSTGDADILLDDVTVNAIEIRKNGHLFDSPTEESNIPINIDGQTFKRLFGKVDFVTRVRDSHIQVSGEGSSGNNGINSISYLILNYGEGITESTIEIQNVNFDRVPLNSKANLMYDKRSTLSKHIYVITNSPLEEPYDRFFNSRLKQNVTEDWSSNPNKDANNTLGCTYPDGKYSILTSARDIKNYDNSIRNDKSKLTHILIDNFHPFIEKVEILSGGLVVDKDGWEWNESEGELENIKNIRSNPAALSNDILVKIYTSEPMKEGTVKFTMDNATFTCDKDPSSSDGKVWRFPFNPNVLQEIEYKMSIEGRDLANNPLTENPKDCMPIRISETNFEPKCTTDNKDRKYSFTVEDYIPSGCSIDPYEANNSRATAILPSNFQGIGGSLSKNKQIESYICSETDVDWFKVPITEEGFLNIYLENLPDNYQLAAYFEDNVDPLHESTKLYNRSEHIELCSNRLQCLVGELNEIFIKVYRRGFNPDNPSSGGSFDPDEPYTLRLHWQPQASPTCENPFRRMQISIEGPQSICSGGSAKLTAENISNATYKWFDATGNYIQSGREITVNPLSTATYTVRVYIQSDIECIEPREGNHTVTVENCGQACTNPSTPLLSSPKGSCINPGEITTLTPTLQWNAVSGATSYDVFIAATNIVNCQNDGLIYQADCISGTSHTLSIPNLLQDGKVYRWNMVANMSESGVCNKCFSPYSSPEYFSIDLGSGTDCNIPTNLQTIAANETAAVLDWTAPNPIPQSYDLKYRPAGGTWLYVQNIADTDYALTGLLCATNYEWNVRSSCSPTSISGYSLPDKTFRTDDCPTGGNNDDCNNAITLKVSSYCDPTSGNIYGATQSYPATFCRDHSSAQVQDVWYKFEATSNSHEIRVDPSSELDAVIDVRRGSCSGPNVDCIDNAGGEGNEEILELNNLQIGEDYYVRVYDDTETGIDPGSYSFFICVIGENINPDCDPPRNRDVDLNIDEFNFDLEWDAPNSGADAYEVRWKFGSESYRSVEVNEPKVKIIAQLCDIRVYWSVRSICGDGKSSWLSDDDFYINCVDNDECNDALELFVSSECDPIQSSIKNASQTEPAELCEGTTSVIARDVWFTFVATDNQVTIEVLPNSTMDAAVELRKDDCDGDVLDCADSGGGKGKREIISFNNLDEGDRYWIRVYHSSGNFIVPNESDFEICLYSNPKYCEKPENLRERNKERFSVRLDWAEPDNEPTSYWVFFKEESDSDIQYYFTNFTYIDLENLNCETTYEWTVASLCGYSLSPPPSFESFTTDCCFLCEEPDNPSVGAINQTSVELDWNPVAGADDYDILVESTDGSYSESRKVSNPDYVLTGLTCGTDYWFEVEANCECNGGPETDKEYFSTLPCNVVCEIPTSVTVTGISQSEAELSWDDMGANVDLYYAQVRNNSTGTTQSYEVGGRNNITMSNLDCSGNYEIKVRSYCSGELTEWSNIVSFNTLACPECNPPINLSSIAHFSRDSVTVLWGKPFPEPMGYGINYKEVDALGWIYLESNKASKSINNLECGTEYMLRVNSLCNGLQSVYSDTILFSPLDCLPECETPYNLSISSTEVSSTSATVRYSYSDALQSNEYFTVLVRNESGALVSQKNSTTTSVEINNLICENTYRVELFKHCAEGNSDTVELSFDTETCSPCDEITSAYANNLTGRSFNVDWRPGYLLSRDAQIRFRVKGSNIWQYLNISFDNASIENLDCETVYEWQVRRDCGEDDYSEYFNLQETETLSCDTCVGNAIVEKLSSEQTKLIACPAEQRLEYGNDVTIWDEHIFIGGWHHSIDASLSRIGYVDAYKIVNDDVQYVERLTPDFVETQDQYGRSVSADNNVLAIGGNGVLGLYSYQNDVWHADTIMRGPKYFGFKVDATEDWVITNSLYYTSDNDLYFINKNGNDWDIINEFALRDTVLSVAIDGKWAAVSTINKLNIFYKDGANWAEWGELSGMTFGVDIFEDWMVSVRPENGGTLRISKVSESGLWELFQEISLASEFSTFQNPSVSIDNDVIVVGSVDGKVLRFDWNGNEWKQNIIKYSGLDQPSLSAFGKNLSLSGKYAIIGDPYNTYMAYRQGAAYLQKLEDCTKPAIEVLASTDAICSGEPVTLSATGSANYYVWSTGDTATAITVAPSAPSVYNVIAYTLDGCSDTASIVVNVAPAPNLAVSASATVTCDQAVTVTAISDAANLSWSTGDTTSSILVQPTATTLYSVTATNDFGCSTLASSIITVDCEGTCETPFNLQVPQSSISQNEATVTYGVTQTIEEGHLFVVDLYNEEGENTHAYISSSDSVAFSDLSCGATYTVQVVRYCGEEFSDSSELTSFTTAPCDVNCDGSIEQTIVELESCELLPNDTMIYQNIHGCDSSVIIITTVLPSYETNITTYICTPITTDLIIDSLETVKGCDSVVLTNIIRCEASASESTVQVCDPSDSGVAIDTLLNYCGCDSVSTITYVYSDPVIVIDTIITCDFDISNDTTLNTCDSLKITVYDDQYGIDVDLGEDIAYCSPRFASDKNQALNLGASYEWNSGDTTTYKRLTETGEYILMAYNDICLDRDTINFTLTDTVIADFSFVVNENEVIFINESFAAHSYSWDFGDSSSSMQEDPVHVYSVTGEYEVALEAFGCDTAVIVKLLTAITDIENFVSSDQLIRIYPNPTSGTLNIEITEFDLGEAELSIYNSNGQIVDQRIFDIIQPNQLEIIELNLPDGNYLLFIKTKEKLAIKKLNFRR